MKTKTMAVVRVFATLLLALCVISMASLGVFAETTINQAVMDDTSGVVQIKLVYVDPNNHVEHNIQSGTGFLINDSNVITCNHVVTMTPETLATAATNFGVETTVVQNNCKIQISVLRDLTIDATVKNSSEEMDYAILTLSSQLYDRTYLPIRSSATVQQTEEAFALSFPGEVVFFQDVNTYTSDDVTISSGRVNKLNTIGGVDYIQTSTRITSGNSGSPLVDANGAVIGICQGSTGEGFDNNYFYAIAIDQLTRSLDALGVDYTKVTDVVTPTPPSTPDPTINSGESSSDVTEQNGTVDKSSLSALVTDMQDIAVEDYDEQSGAAFSSAMTAAQNVLANEEATQAQVDEAQAALNQAFSNLETASNSLLFIIIGGVVAAVVVIVVVVIVVIKSKKKKQPAASAAYNPKAGAAPAPVGNGFSPVNPVAPVPATTPVNYNPAVGVGAGETTVLNQGAGETTVLNQNQNAQYGMLVRNKNKETIRINSANFIIGKERAKVNYCVMDNTSVSRTHAAIRNRGNVAYLADMNATNGTFVNGVRLNPGQETPLKNGDVILLADEEFTYHT